MYILGLEDDPDEPVSIVFDPETVTTSSVPHRILLSAPHDPTAAFVSLYGCFDFRVELGQAAVLPEPIIVICDIDGLGMRVGSRSEANERAEHMRNETIISLRPWIETDGS